MSLHQNPIPLDRLRDRIASLELQAHLDRSELKVANTLLLGAERMQGVDTRFAAFEALCRTLQEAMGADRVVVLGDAPRLFEREESRACTVLFASPPAPELSVECSLIDWLGKRRNVHDVSRLPDAPVIAALANGAGSMMSVPLDSEQGERGAVLCFHDQTNRFSPEDLQILRRLTDMVSAAIRNIRLYDKHELLAGVVQGSSAPLMLVEPWERGGKIVYVNPAFETLSARSSDELVGTPFLIDRPARSEERIALRDAFRSGKSGRYQVWNDGPDGKRLMNEMTFTPIRNAEGALQYMMLNHRDITAETVAKEEIRRMEQRLETAMSSVTSAILVLGAAGEQVYSNQAMDRLLRDCEMAGSKQGGSQDDLVVFFGGPWAETEVTLEDGRVFLTRCYPTGDGGHVVTGTNVTQIKKAERELKLRAAAIDSTAEGVAIVNTSAVVTYANPAFAAIQGCDNPAAAIGRKWCDPFLHEDVARLVSEIRPLVATIGVGRIQMRTREEETLRTFDVSITRIDEEMRVIVAHDITSRLEYEETRDRLEKNLQEYQKSEGIGRLAAGVAHDFNNLLAVINGHAALLMAGEANPSRIKQYASRIDEASSRAAKMINRFLDLGSSQSRESMIDMRNLLTESQDLLQSTVSAEVQFSLELCDDGVELVCNPSDLLRLALNLVQNANDALDGARGQIAQTLTRVSGGDFAGTPMQSGQIDPDRDYARYSVRDTGSGISEALRDKMFRRNFSTKGDRGSGIGLMAVSEIVEAHEGAIRVESTLGEGTEIEIYLPVSNFGVSAVAPGEIGSVRLDGKLILLVDDDPQVSEMMAAFLERLGAEVSTCDDPMVAAEFIAEERGAWSAVVSDYNMPGMNGGQLAARIRELDPDLPVVIVTALARKLNDPNLNDQTIAGLLAKPIDLNALATVLSDHARGCAADDTA